MYTKIFVSRLKMAAINHFDRKEIVPQEKNLDAVNIICTKLIAFLFSEVL